MRDYEGGSQTNLWFAPFRPELRPPEAEKQEKD